MTESEAQTQADANNVILVAAAITDKENKIYERFSSLGVSNWFIQMTPTKYNAQYNAATLEQRTAFLRVYLATTTTVGETDSGFVAEFDIQGALDPVLSPYLGL